MNFIALCATKQYYPQTNSPFARAKSHEHISTLKGSPATRHISTLSGNFSYKKKPLQNWSGFFI